MSQVVTGIRGFNRYDEWRTLVETNLKPNNRAEKYRLIAGEIRVAARDVRLEESRASLLNLATAYERMANAAEGIATEPPSAPDSISPVLAPR